MGEKKAFRGVGGSGWIGSVGVVGFEGFGECEDASPLWRVAVLLDLGEPKESRVEGEASILERLL